MNAFTLFFSVKLIGVKTYCANLEDERECDELGQGCRKVKRYGPYEGDFQHCCCKSDLCNRANAIYTSTFLMLTVFAFLLTLDSC